MPGRKVHLAGNHAHNSVLLAKETMKTGGGIFKGSSRHAPSKEEEGEEEEEEEEDGEEEKKNKKRKEK
ncbi:hypothetical protein HZH66_008907 [Vespula vulgaris]|uniref:Uncharacterized protein n=1 Tax=Vespula vulgaris TaxID=7454 RepID=A0A834JU73_VESVU|nr:hypothetical protein HZH66_008907 [Vespula vulgaris]